MSWWPRHTGLLSVARIEPNIQKKAKGDFNKMIFEFMPGMRVKER